jgi:predicted HicB family RNase H-like nuclease
MELTLKPYKGYHAVIHQIDLDANLIAGRVAGLTRDLVTFYASTPADLQREFEAGLNAYLEGCAEDGVTPEKPASGVFQVRVPPDIHRKLITKAQLRRESLNAVVAEALEAAVADLDLPAVG